MKRCGGCRAQAQAAVEDTIVSFVECIKAIAWSQCRSRRVLKAAGSIFLEIDQAGLRFRPYFLALKHPC